MWSMCPNYCGVGWNVEKRGILLGKYHQWVQLATNNSSHIHVYSSYIVHVSESQLQPLVVSVQRIQRGHLQWLQNQELTPQPLLTLISKKIPPNLILEIKCYHIGIIPLVFLSPLSLPRLPLFSLYSQLVSVVLILSLLVFTAPRSHRGEKYQVLQLWTPILTIALYVLWQLCASVKQML